MSLKDTLQICPSVGVAGRLNVRVACVLPFLYKLSVMVEDAVTVPVPVMVLKSSICSALIRMLYNTSNVPSSPIVTRSVSVILAAGVVRKLSFAGDDVFVHNAVVNAFIDAPSRKDGAEPL